MKEILELTNNSYVSTDFVFWEGVLKKVKKAALAFTPIIEGFTNAVEAIIIRKRKDNNFNGSIKINIYSRAMIAREILEFEKLEIIDNGIGFNLDEFTRFNSKDNDTKGFSNKGTGRLQYLHYFNETVFKSQYIKEDSIFERKFRLSSDKKYLENKAVVYHEYNKEISKQNNEIETVVQFLRLKENSPKYNSLNARDLKSEICNEFALFFKLDIDSLPLIKITHFIDNVECGVEQITKSDFEGETNHYKKNINFYGRTEEGEIVKLNEFVEFCVTCFKLTQEEADENEIHLTAKGRIIRENDSDFCARKTDYLPAKKLIEGFHYVFMVSSVYLDENVSDQRDKVELHSLASFAKSNDIFEKKSIIPIEDLKSFIREAITNLVPELFVIIKDHNQQVSNIKNTLSFDTADVKDAKIGLNDTIDIIINKLHSQEATKKSKLSTKLFYKVEELKAIDTTNKNYINILEEKTKELVEIIPVQNKNDLSHYVARRRIVLDIFDMILTSNLDVMSSENRNKGEELMHDLIFKMGSKNSDTLNDLWILNEEFIHYKGTSNLKLDSIKIDGENLIRQNLSKDEKDFFDSNLPNFGEKRPDIFLYPSEGKCIIIELKSPTTEVGVHLNQISMYATLIFNLSKSDFNIDKFYGYLIGENFTNASIRAFDGDFIEAISPKYLYRSHKQISGFFNRTGSQGSLYTEVLSYTNLLERAKIRNSVFLQKLNIDFDSKKQ